MTLARRLKQINTVTPLAKYVFIILTGIIYALLDHIGVVSAAFNEGLIITLLLVIAEQVVHAGLKEDVAKAAGAEAGAFDPAESETLADVWKAVKKDIGLSLNSSATEFSVVNPEFSLAVKSYLLFWEKLLRAQKTSRKGESIHVRAIHSLEMDVWDDRLLRYQKDFSEAGGKITRVLCGYGKVPEETVQRAYVAMQDALVTVKYYDISKKQVDHTFDWDFLHIARTNEAVIWTTSKVDPTKIRKAIFTSQREYDGRKLDDLWRDILDHSVSLP